MSWPAGVVTFLFTDVEGSTRLSHRLGSAYGQVLREHDALIEQAVADAGGVVVSHAGDGVFAAFGDAADAVRACRRLHRSLTAHPWPAGVRLRVRMGLHTGEAEPHGRDYTALAVHLAARVSAAAHGGQLLCTWDTAVAAGPVAGATRLWGGYLLAGFEQPVDLVEVALDDREDRSPGDTGERPPRAAAAPFSDLPLPPTSFVGRANDLATMHRLVDEHRLVTVVGPGGVGKTRLVADTRCC